MIDVQTTRPAAEPTRPVPPRNRRVARRLEICCALALCGVGAAGAGGFAMLVVPRLGIADILIYVGSAAVLIAMVAATVLCVTASAPTRSR